MDPEGARLRVRNTGEIVLVKAGEEEPDKPVNPDKPEKPDVKPLPQTGGSFRNLIITVVAIAVIACGAVVLVGRKKEQN
jgi:hypothetical protein